MKKYSFLAVLFVLIIASSIFAQPKIVPTETNYDFGDIAQGDVVKHNFIVKNEGTEQLIIKKVRASCGCTAVKPEKNELAPGESTTIEVSFDSHGRHGVQKKYVYVFSNDPEQKQLRLFFTTNIVVDAEVTHKKEDESSQLEISQAEVDFGNIAKGDKKEQEIYFINKGKSELVINQVKSTCTCVSATITRAKYESGAVGIMTITFDSTDRSGEVTRTVTVYSNDKENPQRTIVVRANVVDGDKS